MRLRSFHSLDRFDLQIIDAEAEKLELMAVKAPIEQPVQLVTAKTQRIKDLEIKVEEYQRVQAGNRVLQGDEHRQVLKEALKSAKEILIIISPWIGRGATDNEIIRLIEGALRRGVWVVIGFGMPPRDGRQEQTPIDREVEARFSQIKSQPYGAKLIYQNWQRTHEKILVCDNSFCVVTSFNWLSYKGGQGFRREMGIYLVDTNQINEVKQLTLHTFESLPNELSAFTKPRL